MDDFVIKTQEQLEAKVLEWGFLPFFRNGVPGFSIEEHTPQELWFDDERDGPWEWKGPVIGSWRCAYGKFFAGKAGFVSLEWLPDFINWRRSQFPLDELGDEANHVYDVLRRHESLLSKDLKVLSGYSLSRKRRKDPFGLRSAEQPKDGPACDKLLLQLEMATYVCIADFEYLVSRKGERYGWGVARYCTPEAMYGNEIALPQRTPDESLRRMITHLQDIFPQAPARKMEKIIR